MDKQPLNTGEQKDMTEFFTDLIGKIEEMSPVLVRELCFVKPHGTDATLLDVTCFVVASVCSPLPTRMQQLQHCCPNNVDSCCVRLL